MNWTLAKKLFFALTVIGILPMIIFSFLTISAYQELLDKQGEYLEKENKEIITTTQLNHQNIKIQAFLIFALLSIFVIFFSIILVKKFIHPIKKLTQGTESLKQGDLSTRIKIESDDEFSRLADSFNEMASQLNDKIKQLQNSKESIKKAYTDLKQQREKSDEERHKISTIIENFSDPIIMVDNQWKISLFNPSAQDVFKIKQEDMGKKVKKDDERYLSFESFKNIIKTHYNSKIIEKKKKTLVEEVVVSNNKNDPKEASSARKQKYSKGDLIYKVVTIPVCDETNVCLGHVKIFHNLTREKMIDEMKSEFISIAAHQLRTPLTAIKWAMRMVLTKEAGGINEEQEELLKQGYKSNERLIKLVNNMLNVSRIEENRFEYSFDKNDISEIIDLVIENLDKEMKKKNIEFEIKKTSRIPKIYMDNEKIELVLQNLLENAVKFTPKRGKISLTIKAGKENITIKVKDNGVGIPKESQANLFSKFFRAKNVAKMEVEGSGLGLFITKNIINKHEGDITYESEEGKGTEFIVTLPIKK